MKSCKYKKLKQQQSLDGGNSWFDVYQLGALVTKKGDLIASNSSDCGYMGEYIRWVETIGYICDNTTRKKYAKERKQTSTDGINWTDTTEFRQGRLLEEDSMDCGYAPPLEPDTQYKWVDSGFECGSNLSSDSTIVMEAPGELTKETVYRWVVANGNDDYVCDNKVKYYLYVKQQSTDGGLTWSEVQPRETQKGAVMSNDSKECSCNTKVTYVDGTAKEYKLEGALNVWDIDNRANVKYISLGTCVTSIPDASFDNWDNMERIDIPDSVTSFGNRILAGLEKLNTITIPSSVTSIGDSIFENSFNITDITYQGTVDEWNAITKGENWHKDSALEIVHCSDGDISLTPNKRCQTSANFYKPGTIHQGTGKKYYKIVGEYSYNRELNGAFVISLGYCITSIASKAFQSKNLEIVGIPYSVASIADNAFFNCISLQTIRFTGTMAQWNSITKGTNWISGAPAIVVRCTDGNVPI